MILKLICNETQEIKEAPQGYSWTFLFFGGFTPIYRKDYKRAITAFLIYGIAMLIVVMKKVMYPKYYLYQFSVYIIYALYAFVYNKRYTQELLDKGYVGYDKESIEYLEKYYESKK